MKGVMQKYFKFLKKFDNKRKSFHQFLMIESLDSTLCNAFEVLLEVNTSNKMYQEDSISILFLGSIIGGENFNKKVILQCHRDNTKK